MIYSSLDNHRAYRMRVLHYTGQVSWVDYVKRAMKCSALRLPVVLLCQPFVENRNYPDSGLAAINKETVKYYNKPVRANSTPGFNRLLAKASMKLTKPAPYPARIKGHIDGQIEWKPPSFVNSLLLISFSTGRFIRYLTI